MLRALYCKYYMNFTYALNASLKHKYYSYKIPMLLDSYCLVDVIIGLYPARRHIRTFAQSVVSD